MKESAYGLVSLSAFGVVSVLDLNHSKRHVGFPGGSTVKNLPAMQETWVQFLDQEDPLEEEMATHSSILA